MSSFQEDFTKKRGVFDDHAAVLLDAATMPSKNVDDTTNTTNTNTNRDDDDEEHVVFVSRVR